MRTQGPQASPSRTAPGVDPLQTTRSRGQGGRKRVWKITMLRSREAALRPDTPARASADGSLRERTARLGDPSGHTPPQGLPCWQHYHRFSPVALECSVAEVECRG